MALLHVTLATRDVQATSRFFQETLGWQPIDRPQNIPMTAAWLSLGDGRELHLLEVADFEPSAFEQEYGRHVAVSYPRGEFDALKRRLAERGAELIEPKRATPLERFFFREPGGYVFEIVAE